MKVLSFDALMTGQLVAGDGAAFDHLGRSVDIDGGSEGPTPVATVVVGGGPDDDYGSIPSAGSARIWKRGYPPGTSRYSSPTPPPS
jgi:hypothetical protein